MGAFLPQAPSARPGTTAACLAVHVHQEVMRAPQTRVTAHCARSAHPLRTQLVQARALRAVREHTQTSWDFPIARRAPQALPLQLTVHRAVFPALAARMPRLIIQ